MCAMPPASGTKISGIFRYDPGVEKVSRSPVARSFGNDNVVSLPFVTVGVSPVSGRGFHSFRGRPGTRERRPRWCLRCS